MTSDPVQSPSLPARWRLRAGFAWDHSADPRLTTARTTLDTRIRPLVCAVSRPGPDAPSIGYAGVRPGLVKIHQLLERQAQPRGGTPPVQTRLPVSRPALLAGRWLPPADLVAVGCTPAQARRLPDRAALVLPFRLHLVVDLPDGGGQWRRHVSRRERQWFTAQGKSRDWGLELASDDASFHFFYDRMHLPTMRLRHGGRTRSEGRARAFECLFRGGLLAFATLGGERVSGALCHVDRETGTLTIRLVGVLDGSQQLYDDGALRVHDHLMLDWADRGGLRHVDFGGTEAWVSQGTFQWKRKFGARAAVAPDHLGNLAVWWHARRDTPAVRDFLVANPVLEQDPADESRLRAVYFHDESRPARYDLSHRCANVTELRTAHLDAFLSGVPAGPRTTAPSKGRTA